jgi:hypothetical protein
MKNLLVALLLAAPVAAFPQAASQPTDVQLDALVAFARTYGVVRYFHPSDSLDKVRWDRFLVHAAVRMGSVVDAKDVAPRLEELFAPAVEGFRVVAAGTATLAPKGEGPIVEWRHLGYGMEAPPPNSGSTPYVSWRTYHLPLHNQSANPGFFQNDDRTRAPVNAEPVYRVALGSGLEAQVPIALPMSATKVGEAQATRLAALDAQLEGAAPAADPVSREQAWAEGIALWNVARHFYPYWDVVKVDWDASLRPWLAAQPATQSRAQLARGLERFIAAIDDGHARIVGAPQEPRGFLRISLHPAGTRWIVDESQVPEIKVGDVLAVVDGKTVAQWYALRAAVESGSEQYKRWRVRGNFLAGPRDAKVKLALQRSAQRVEATLAYDGTKPLGPPRLPALSEIKPGIWYVDVRRFAKAEFDKSLDALGKAKAIVFDLRGYPSREAYELAAFWVTGVDSAQWMVVPRFDQPGGKAVPGWNFGWQVERNAALEKPQKLLLVDARTGSFGESLAAYFPGQKTGRVVGEPTAGVNGNVALATLPTGLKFGFTGMRVFRHDGTLLHNEGIQPDVTVVPTPEGIRAGRDEVLDRALSLVSP